eukprot:TRINITY_DN26543_c0_g1_i1.p1 TRINITY_DN26543_c0_g1~~TRINITY_DN26543_c0_g1_i1.p1  ORF type:complete len:811 (-),score=201.87 TRINITY_DN26543_c0_g1_i1:189-2621(-)
MFARPLPPGGHKAISSGTYTAEQRESKVGTSYELKSSSHSVAYTSASKRPGGKTDTKRANAERGEEVKRKGARRFDASKCLVLPALKSIEPLLKNLDKKDRPVDEEAGQSGQRPVAGGGGQVPTLPAISEARSHSRMSRLWESSRSRARLGDLTTPVPTDEEFQAWITSPQQSRGAGGGASSSSSSPAHANGYHVILSRKTFDDANMHADKVAYLLAEHLSMSHDEAMDKAEESLGGSLLTPLKLLHRQREAMAAVEKLRAAGLLIQVVTDVGLPAHMMKKGKKKASAETYTELIQKGLRDSTVKNQSRSLPPLVLPPANKGEDGHSPPSQRSARRTRRKDRAAEPAESQDSLRRRYCDTAWQRQQTPLKVVPEDPVQALFDAEALLEAVPTPQSNKSAASGGSLLKSLMRKHQTELSEQIAERRDGKGATEKDIQQKRVHSVIQAITRQISEEEEKEKLTKQKEVPGVTKARKEACLMLRFLVYGNDYTGLAAGKSQDVIWTEAIGSQEMVNQLLRFWKRVDNDGSGRVDIGEFRTFAADELRTRLTVLAESAHNLPPELMNVGSDPIKDMAKYISKVVDKLAQAILGKKSSFVMEDVMRVIWVGAGPQECKQMTRWVKEFEKTQASARVGSPPVLSRDEFEGLCGVFRHFDDDNSGEVTLEELVLKGLIYQDQIEDYRREWDRNGDGTFDMLEFCEMMCPLGYRAYPASKVGTREDGTRLAFDALMNGWSVEVPEERTRKAPSPKRAEAKRAAPPTIDTQGNDLAAVPAAADLEFVTPTATLALSHAPSQALLGEHAASEDDDDSPQS